MKRFFVNPALDSDHTKVFTAESEMDAAAQYMLARPVNKDFVVSGSIKERSVIRLSDLLSQYPELKKILPTPEQEAAAGKIEAAESEKRLILAKYGKIGGWLAAIGVALALKTSFTPVILHDLWKFMQGPEYQALAIAVDGYAKLIHFELALAIIQFVLAAVGCYLFIGRRKLARPLLIVMCLAYVVGNIVDIAWFISIFGPNLQDDMVGYIVGILRNLIVHSIAAVYLFVSERARMTFVR